MAREVVIVSSEVGQTHGRTFGEVAPATGTLYEYRVQPVDANRQPAYPCCGFCSPCNVFQLCPALSIDHWEITTCVTPAATRSWGQLKTIYR